MKVQKGRRDVVRGKRILSLVIVLTIVLSISAPNMGLANSKVLHKSSKKGISVQEKVKPKDSDTIRIINYNIQAGIGNDGDYDIRRTAEVIRKSGADIVGLTEVDVHFDSRSNFDNQVEILAEELGMYSFYGPIYDLDPYEEGQPRRKYGMAILSKYPIIDAHNHEITRLSTQDENPEPRPMPGFPEAKINVDGKVFSFYVTHLDYRGNPMIREMQVDDTLNIFSEVVGPKILVGDLNALPDAPEVGPLFEYLNDSWELGGGGEGYTFPVSNPHKRIDYILVNQGINVVNSEVIDTEASDHFPVITDIVLKEIKEEDLNNVGNVVNLIKEIPSLEDITLEYKGLVQEARERYNSLTNEQKELVIDYKIKKAEEIIIELEKEALNEAIAKAEEAIETLPPLEDIGIEDKEVVLEAKELVDKVKELDSDAVVKGEELIEQMLGKIKYLEDEIAASEVIKMIEELPNVKDLTLDDKGVVEEAIKAYNLLTEEQKVLVKNLDKLISAEEKISELEELLVSKVDKTKLAELIDEVEKLNKNDYTEESWERLETVFKLGIKIYEDKNATQKEVDETINNLVKAVEGLELKPVASKVPKKPKGKDKVKGKTLPKTGAENCLKVYIIGLLFMVLGIGFRREN